MGLLETTGQHRPVFYHPRGNEPQPLDRDVQQRLDCFTTLPLFADILEKLLEKRPDVAPDGKVRVRTVTVQDALIEHAEFYTVPAGTVIFQEGSFGEHLFFILKGKVRTSTRVSLGDDDTNAVPLGELGEGAFFGEMSALSMNAHLFTAETVTATELLLVPQFIVQELAATQDRFRNPLMQSYVQRAVQTLLRRIPILRTVPERDVAALLPKVELKTFQAGDLILEEGDAPDNLYVIHQGLVKISQQEKGKHRVLSYLVEGDCFGETAVLTGSLRSASATAMSMTEVLVVPGVDFQRLVTAHPQAIEEARGLENLRRLDTDLADVTFIGQRMEHQAEVMPNLDVLAIDETICVRCDNCVKACAAAHEDGISRLIRKGTIFEDILLPTACRFCQDPVCLLCKSGGIKRDKDGDIYFTDSCIGCSGCAERCPYGNIIMVDTEELDQQTPPTLAHYLLQSVAQQRGETLPPEVRPRLKKVPVKCDLDKGHLFPACVSHCPTGAIKRYRADELDGIISAQERKQRAVE